MSLIAGSLCVRGAEELVELALREAVSNAMLQGSLLDARKLIHVRCCREGTKGVFIVVRDQRHGFDPNKVSDPLAVENLGAERGRSIHLMNWLWTNFPLNGEQLRSVCARHQALSEKYLPGGLMTELHDG